MALPKDEWFRVEGGKDTLTPGANAVPSGPRGPGNVQPPSQSKPVCIQTLLLQQQKTPRFPVRRAFLRITYVHSSDQNTSYQYIS